jgi:hypothetical protein
MRESDVLVFALLKPPVNALLQVTCIRANLYGEVCPDLNYVGRISHISIGKRYEVNMAVPP